MALHFVGSLLLKTITKLRKFPEGILSCCKLQIRFKTQNNSANSLCFKHLTAKELTFSVACKFQCRLCKESYCDQYGRQLTVRIGEHFGISPLEEKMGLRVVPLAVACYYVAIHHLLTVFMC